MGIINKKTLAVAICALSLSLPGFAQSFTLNANKITVKQAMNALQQQTGYSFVFYASDLDVNKQISIQANNVSLQEAVRQILEGQKDLTYRMRISGLSSSMLRLRLLSQPQSRMASAIR